MGHNAYWFDQIGVVGEYRSYLESSLASIMDQMASEIHIASFLLGFPDFRNNRIRRREKWHCPTAHLRWMD